MKTYTVHIDEDDLDRAIDLCTTAHEAMGAAQHDHSLSEDERFDASKAKDRYRRLRDVFAAAKDGTGR